MDEQLTCHRCGSTALVLTEVQELHHSWSSGLRLVDGKIEPVGEAHHSDGDVLPSRTLITCEGCGHRWRPRRTVGMPYEPR